MRHIDANFEKKSEISDLWFIPKPGINVDYTVRVLPMKRWALSTITFLIAALRHNTYNTTQCKQTLTTWYWHLTSKTCSSVLFVQMLDVISYIFPIESFVFNTKLPDMSHVLKPRILQQQEKLPPVGLDLLSRGSLNWPCSFNAQLHLLGFPKIKRAWPHKSFTYKHIPS